MGHRLLCATAPLIKNMLHIHNMQTHANDKVLVNHGEVMIDTACFDALMQQNEMKPLFPSELMLAEGSISSTISLYSSQPVVDVTTSVVPCSSVEAKGK